MEKYCRAGQVTDDDIIRRMRFACWITEAADTYSEYVTIIAVPLQNWLHERPSLLCCTYIAWHVITEMEIVHLAVHSKPLSIVTCDICLEWFYATPFQIL